MSVGRLDPPDRAAAGDAGRIPDFVIVRRRVPTSALARRACAIPQIPGAPLFSERGCGRRKPFGPPTASETDSLQSPSCCRTAVKLSGGRAGLKTARPRIFAAIVGDRSLYSLACRHKLPGQAPREFANRLPGPPGLVGFHGHNHGDNQWKNLSGPLSEKFGART